MKKINIGGQAVIEGVMMKGPSSYAISVRKEDGKIETKTEKLKKRPKWTQLFFIRGIANLIDMLVLGIKSLIWSSNQFVEEESEKEAFGLKETIMLMAVSFGFVVLFFVALPYFLTNLAGFKEEVNPLLFNLIDGAIRIALFLAYLVLISRIKDIKRIFEYHGAEHKAVHCYEAKKELTVQNIRKFSTLHPRCGTSFIILVLVISILIFSLLPSAVILLYDGFLGLNFWMQKGILFPLRIMLIPVIAGLSYELLKLSDKHKDRLLLRMLIKPGLWMQKLTTKQPDDRQIEVAVRSLKAVLSVEKHDKSENYLSE